MKPTKARARFYRRGNYIRYVLFDSRGVPVYENGGSVRIWGRLVSEAHLNVGAVRAAEQVGVIFKEWWWLPRGVKGRDKEL